MRVYMMGVDLYTYRLRIGSFSQPSRCKFRMRTLSVSSNRICLCIRVVLFVLLVAQCVEHNPGPIDKAATGRGSPSGRGSGRGANRAARNSYNTRQTASHGTHAAAARSPPVVRNSQRMEATQDPSQYRISTWLSKSIFDQDATLTSMEQEFFAWKRKYKL